jgi:hypothetical protein
MKEPDGKLLSGAFAKACPMDPMIMEKTLTDKKILIKRIVCPTAVSFGSSQRSPEKLSGDRRLTTALRETARHF